MPTQTRSSGSETVSRAVRRRLSIRKAAPPVGSVTIVLQQHRAPRRRAPGQAMVLVGVHAQRRPADPLAERDGPDDDRRWGAARVAHRAADHQTGIGMPLTM